MKELGDCRNIPIALIDTSQPRFCREAVSVRFGILRDLVHSPATGLSGLDYSRGTGS